MMGEGDNAVVMQEDCTTDQKMYWKGLLSRHEGMPAMKRRPDSEGKTPYDMQADPVVKWFTENYTVEELAWHAVKFLIGGGKLFTDQEGRTRPFVNDDPECQQILAEKRARRQDNFKKSRELRNMRRAEERARKAGIEFNEEEWRKCLESGQSYAPKAAPKPPGRPREHAHVFLTALVGVALDTGHWPMIKDIAESAGKLAIIGRATIYRYRKQLEASGVIESVRILEAFPDGTKVRRQGIRLLKPEVDELLDCKRVDELVEKLDQLNASVVSSGSKPVTAPESKSPEKIGAATAAVPVIADPDDDEMTI